LKQSKETTMMILLLSCLVLFLSCETTQVDSFISRTASVKHQVYHESRRKSKNSVRRSNHRLCGDGRLLTMISTTFQLDPDSEQARSIVVDQLGLSEHQYSQLQKLSHLVSEWNERINLISRKDCNPATVFGRHVLPSLACCALDNEKNPFEKAKRAIDVGTGGGFPGLPLAIAYPDCDFVLLDSVGKKLTAVQEMANELGLDNVQVHHGRAEESFRSTKTDLLFDVATGRSVSSIPQFCAWMQHLIRRAPPNNGNDEKKNKTSSGGGHLLYWIGGDISEVDDILQESKHEILSDTPVKQLLVGIESDKRILVCSRDTVVSCTLFHLHCCRFAFSLLTLFLLLELLSHGCIVLFGKEKWPPGSSVITAITRQKDKQAKTANTETIGRNGTAWKVEQEEWR
jgi:16S rRNA (guanine527-N7)-methyltransferase